MGVPDKYYLCGMYVRKKINPSGITSVQVIDKSTGKYRLIKTIGSSSDTSTVKPLYQQGKQWISNYVGELNIFDTYQREREEKQVTEYLLSNIENILQNGTQLILNEVFKTTGFDAINDDILKKLVIAV
jgi:hypothetical protein